MRLTKIYTKIGDKGTTLLATGAKIPKSAARIEAYGSVDELNAHIGLLRDLLKQAFNDASVAAAKDLDEALRRIQNELFDLGGELSTPLEALRLDRQQVVSEACVTRLEQEMDCYNETLEPLANFVLPGGNLCNSQAHVARTVCRRAERNVVKLYEVEAQRSEPMIYLNRLSDWLFVVSRLISKELGTPEILWAQQAKSL